MYRSEQHEDIELFASLAADAITISVGDEQIDFSSPHQPTSFYDVGNRIFPFSEDPVHIGGNGIEHYLRKQENVKSFGLLLADVFLSACPSPTFFGHIDCDVDYLNRIHGEPYSVFDSHNEKSRVDLTHRNSKMGRFEKMLYFYLLDGIEYITTHTHSLHESSFNSKAAASVDLYLVGKKEQLHRYYEWADFLPDKQDKVEFYERLQPALQPFSLIQ